MNIGIAGAGLMGRLLAWRLTEEGHQVTLFDADVPEGNKNCAYAGAGMLAPISELENSEPLIAELGLASLLLWAEWAKLLTLQTDLPIFFQQAGTLIIAHTSDRSETQRFFRSINRQIMGLSTLILPESLQELGLHYETDASRWRLSAEMMAALEPELNGRFQQGYWIPDEGQIDNRQLLQALQKRLENQLLLKWRFPTRVQKLSPYTVHLENGQETFDWVIDCRGLGARSDWEDLRGVRGEIIRVHAPEVTINRPIRLMHPRYPIYVVPRENNHYVIGATSIESEDFRPITVQSSLELLSVAYSIHPGFSEATILDMQVNCRPALADNLPHISTQPGLIRVNGLYRHGFLISPQLTQRVLSDLKGHTVSKIPMDISMS